MYILLLCETNQHTYIAALGLEDFDEARDEAGVDGGRGDADGGAEGEDLRLRTGRGHRGLLLMRSQMRICVK